MDGGRDHTPSASDLEDAAALRDRVARTVADLRRRSGRSLADLAAIAGIGKSTLHAIESGEANPGIETLWALARALEVPFGALLDPPPPKVRVVRAGEAPRVSSESVDMEAHLMTATAHGARTEVYTLRIDPSESPDLAAHMPGTVEHLLVTAGRLRVGPVGAEVDLDVGDLVSFAGDVAHRYEALVAGTSAVLIIEYT